MSINNTRIKLSIIALYIILVFLTSGCMGRGNLCNLVKDSLYEEEGFQSIVLGRVQIMDRTWDFNKNRVKISGFYMVDNYDTWKVKDGVAYFTGTFIAQAKPGDRGTYAVLGSSSRYLNIDIAKRWRVPPRKLIYLGDFKIEILERGARGAIKGGTLYRYNVQASQNPDELQKALTVFQEHFPHLYEQFKNNIELASYYLLYEDFDLLESVIIPKGIVEDINSLRGDWIQKKNDDKNFNAYHYQDKYIMESKIGLCWVSFIKPELNLPENYDIELTSSWNSGKNDQAYGLLFGIDGNNYYQFAVSAKGSSTVNLNIDNKWQPEPIGWRENTAIKGDGVTENLNRIEVRGDTFTYYVNDILIGKVQNTFNFGEGWAIGMSICGKQKVVFDNLKIIQR